VIYRGSVLALLLMALLFGAGCGDDEETTTDAGSTGDGDGDGDGDDASPGDGDGDGDGDAAVDGGDGDGDGDAGIVVGDVEPNPDGTDSLPPLPIAKTLPIIFVHGFAGSAQQFESQAQRFVANGYPIERIRAFDHDGAGLDIAGYADGVDGVIDQALEDFDVEQVYLIGHSRGTAVSAAYLGDETRRAKVAKYIALDGSPCPATLPCISPNQAMLAGQAHVEVATSKESFAMQYEFLLDEEPEVTEIVPQKEPVELIGRAVNFPANTGREDAMLQIWELDDATGHRVGTAPDATIELGPDGEFGPVTVDSTKLYEFALVPSGDVEGSTHHLYMQKFLRNNHLVRLLSGDAMSDTRVNTNTSDDHTALIAIRMREWYATDDADLDGDQADTLEISVSGGGVDEVEATNVMQEFVANDGIGVHIHDDAASPGESELTALPYFSAQPFQSGVDFFMPASDPPDATITITNVPRGDSDHPQTLHIPNWQSSKHAVTVQFADFPQ
jgi:pimeloyl-ACP methyl ester carboxylesterase